MKRIRLITLLLTVCLLVCSCGNTEAENKNDGVYTMTEMEGKYKTQGRTILYEEGLALLSTADSFEFNANCEGKVSMNLLCEALTFTEELREDPEGYTAADCYFTAYIDGERSETRYNIKKGRAEFVLCEDIAKGEHNFRLVRQSEWEHGRVFLESVCFDGELSEKPEDKELYIEFIGDSIATGFGNIPEEEHESAWGGHPVWQDGTQAFAYMSAEALDADYSIVAIEGIGASCGYWDFTMNEIYENYPRVLEKDYIYKPERTADIVVIELLSNDGANWRDAGLTIHDILDKGIELARMAKEKHPDAKIVFSPGVFPKQFEEKYREEFGGEENGFYIVDLPMNTSGKSGHPDVEGQTMASEALTNFIKEITE
ncbi:MAG: hypothetical protein E7591_03455 [Ruminococcaceae bacterium]|nr:hypothetical protein [Oscillospiraceae bacterium]